MIVIDVVEWVAADLLRPISENALKIVLVVLVDVLSLFELSSDL